MEEQSSSHHRPGTACPPSPLQYCSQSSWRGASEAGRVPLPHPLPPNQASCQQQHEAASLQLPSCLLPQSELGQEGRVEWSPPANYPGWAQEARGLCSTPSTTPALAMAKQSWQLQTSKPATVYRLGQGVEEGRSPHGSGPTYPSTSARVAGGNLWGRKEERAPHLT